MISIEHQLIISIGLEVDVISIEHELIISIGPEVDVISIEHQLIISIPLVLMRDSLHISFKSLSWKIKQLVTSSNSDLGTNSSNSEKQN